MFKTLMKKQLMELFRSYFVNRKTGKSNPPSKIVRTILLFVFVLCMFGYFFSGVCSSLADGLIADGYGSLYFAICGILSALVGIFGSVLGSYSVIYGSKDNDLLLSMPIPSGCIIASKMTGVLLLSLIYESTVFVPSIIQYNIQKPGFSAAALVFQVALLLMTSFLVAAFTCILGFFIALASSRVRNKNITVILFSAAFFVIYYVFYFRLNTYIQMVVTNAEQLDRKIRLSLYPFYALGMGASGDIKYLLIFFAITAVFFAAVVLIMSKTYINVATSNNGAKKKEYKEEPVKEKPQASALLFKEKRHLLGTPVYLLNSGIGILIVPAAAIAMVIFKSRVSIVILQLGEFVILLPALCASVACIINCMSNYTAPSVSLEGKNLWILKSLPIDPKTILFSKLIFNVKMSIVEAELFVLALAYVFGLTEPMTAVLMLITAAYIAFTGTAGLMLNLKNVNLEWTNPTVPVKQDMPVMLTLFISTVSALIPGALGTAALFTGFSVTASLFASLAFYLVLTVLIFRWIMTKGVSKFEEL